LRECVVSISNKFRSLLMRNRKYRRLFHNYRKITIVYIWRKRINYR
jgi:hypothetical protein